MDKEIKPEQVKLVADFLASAIDMEDEMSRDVYGEFLSRENWPALLDEESFKNIKELLIVLIRETERHRQIFSDLFQESENLGHKAEDEAIYTRAKRNKNHGR